MKDADPIEAEEVESIGEMEEVGEETEDIEKREKAEKEDFMTEEEGEDRAGFETSIDNVDELLKGEEIDISDEEITDYIDNLKDDTSESASETKVEPHYDKSSPVNIDTVRKVMGYLDELLGNLPDEVIEKFAKSEYFDMYEKVLEELGITSE